MENKDRLRLSNTKTHNYIEICFFFFIILIIIIDKT